MAIFYWGLFIKDQGSWICLSRIVDCGSLYQGPWIFTSRIMDCGLHPSPPDVDIGEFSWTPVGQFSWAASCDKPLLLAATFPGTNRFVHISKCICSHWNVFVKFMNVFGQSVVTATFPAIAIYVFVQILNCICPNFKMYLSKLTNVFVQTKTYLYECIWRIFLVGQM